MMKLVSEWLCRIGRSLLSFQRYPLSEFPQILDKLAGFIKSAPESFFEQGEFKRRNSFKTSFLLNSEGKERLRSRLEPFSDLYSAGIFPGSEKYDFLNLVGQFLTSVEMRFETLELKDPQTFKGNQVIRKFRKLWGSKEKMNSRNLYNRFGKKSLSEAKKELSKLLSESADILEDLPEGS